MASAAILYANGSTTHSAFGLYNNTNEHHAKGESVMFIKRDGPKFSKVVTVTKYLQLIIIDEYSTLWDELLLMVDKQLRFIRGNDLPFGGCDVILCGDFLQLKPTIGRSLMYAFFDNNLFGEILRSFKRSVLKEQMRASEDKFQEKLVSRLANYRDYPQPIDRKLLSSSCQYCEADSQPTASCEHLHFLTKQDIINDKSWIIAPLVGFTHQSIDYTLLERIKTFAIANNSFVMMWRLDSNESRKNQVDICSLTDEADKSFVEL